MRFSRSCTQSPTPYTDRHNPSDSLSLPFNAFSAGLQAAALWTRFDLAKALRSCERTSCNVTSAFTWASNECGEGRSTMAFVVEMVAGEPDTEQFRYFYCSAWVWEETLHLARNHGWQP